MSYQSIFVDRKSRRVHVWDDKKGHFQLGIRDVTYAYRKSYKGTYKSIYGDVLEKTYNVNPNDPSLYESDVPLDTRALIDLYGDDDSPSENVKTMYYDIEVSSEGGYANNELANKEITSIALYDDITEKHTCYILDTKELLTSYKNEKEEIVSCKDEETLLLKFLNKLEEIQPHIWTGWNIDRFDNLYLYRRLRVVLGETHANRLSPINICYISKFSGDLVIAGVSSVDYYWLYKKYNIKQEVSYTLDYIGTKVVGLGKVPFTGSLQDLFNKDIKKYIDYNIRDVLIVVKLEEKLKFLSQARSVCHKGHVPYDCYGKSSRFIEGAILTYLRRQGLVSKNKPIVERNENGEKSNDKFEGAYVKKPVLGRHEWVFDLDLTSMYPSIIMSLNISPETKYAVITRIEYDKSHYDARLKEITDDYDNLSKSSQDKTPISQYIDERIYSFNSRMFYENKIDYIWIDDVKIPLDKFKEYLLTENLSLSGNGVMYRKEINGKQGILPQILSNWFDERKEYVTTAKKHADNEEFDMYDFFDRKQKVQKVLLNSIYGALGLKSFRFYDKDNAMAVTITGQDIIKTTDKLANLYYKNVLGKDVEEEDRVIYVDTDSVAGNSKVRSNLYGEILLEDLFMKLTMSDEIQITDVSGREFVFPKNLKLPYFSEEDKSVKSGTVEYIEKHKVKKKIYKIKSESGKELLVTEDHSIMVMRDDRLLKLVPSEIQKTDKLIEIVD